MDSNLEDSVSELPYSYYQALNPQRRANHNQGSHLSGISGTKYEQPTTRKTLRDIGNMTFNKHNVKGPLAEVLPYLPDDGAIILLTGDPGSMKSTTLFAVSEYCAREIGKTCYIFGEEHSESFTVKEKVELSGAKSAEAIDSEEFTSRIQHDKGYFKRNGYKAVFIDSKDVFELSADYVLRLRRENEGVIFFVISHINGEGEVRGGRQFTHNVCAYLKTTVSEKGKGDKVANVCYINVAGKSRLGGMRGKYVECLDVIEYIKNKYRE